MKQKLFFILIASACCILVNSNAGAQTTGLINTQSNSQIEIGRPIIAIAIDSVDMYEFVFFTADSALNRAITSDDEILDYPEYSGLPEYLPLQVCVRIKTNNNWSSYGDTCSLTLVSDCSFMSQFLKTVDTEEKMLKLQQDLESLVSLAQSINLDLVEEITIPVVFHIMVPAWFTGTPYEYLPPAKLNEVIQILNDVYSGSRSDLASAANCKIKFCPAMDYQVGANMQSLACNYQGITYYGITYNTYIGSDINLPSGFPYFQNDASPSGFVYAYQSYFPDDKYMSIYIFDLLTDATAAGYANAESFGSSINYIVLRREIVGTNQTLTRYEGYTAAHESGHYFGLDHTWGGAYSTDACNEGDLIGDTPPHDGQNMDCNEFSNTCTGDAYNDPVHNIMNYTSDGCRNHFTRGQAEWMHAVIQTYLPELPYTNSTLEGYSIYCTPIPCIEGASIEGPVENIRCTGETNIEVYVNTATDFSLTVYDESTGNPVEEFDSSDFSSCGDNYCVDFDFTTAGTYNLVLHVEASASNSSTIERIYTIIDCDPLSENLDRAHWHFDHKACLDFSSGIGQLGQTAINAIPAEVSVCSQAGELLFYTNGRDIWNRDHVLQAIQFDGNIEASKGMIALDFGENAGSHNYMMVYLDNNLNLYYRFIAVNLSTYGLSFTSAHTPLITADELIDNNITNVGLSAMGVSATPKADQTGYWLLSSLQIISSNNYFPVAIEINNTPPYLQNTINISELSPILPVTTFPGNQYETTIKMSPNGKYVMYSAPYGSNNFYIFNAQTGIFNDQVVCEIHNFFNKFYEVAFSEDSRYMYMTEIVDTAVSNSSDSINMFYRIKQVDLENIDLCDCNLYGKTIFEVNSAEDHSYFKSMFFMQEGPDDRIYFSRHSDVDANAKYMGIIMHPENAATPDPNDNECGAYGDFIHYPTNQWIKNDLYLPNFVDAKPDSCDLDFRICSENCSDLVVLNISHGEDSTFSWTFNNGINDYQYFGYTPQQTDTLPYSETWTISLSRTGCSDTLTRIFSLHGITANITGNDTICNDGQTYFYSSGAESGSFNWLINGNFVAHEPDIVLTGYDYEDYLDSTFDLIVEVINQFGCTSSDTMQVYVTGFGYDLVSSLDCSQQEPGQVQINIDGITGISYYADIDGDDYLVSNGTNPPYMGLSPGIHSYNLSDDYCLYSGNFITDESLGIDSLSVTTYCPNDSSVVTVYFSGGSSPYIISYNSVTDTIIENHISIAGLSPSSFGFSVIDNYGCELDTVLTFEHNYPTAYIFMSGENYCSNDNNVNLYAVVNGGTPAYTWQWGAFQQPSPFYGTTNEVLNLPSFQDAMYVTVTDAHGCTAIDSIHVPSVISAAILSFDVQNICDGAAGFIDMTILSENEIDSVYWLVPNGSGGTNTVYQEDISAPYTGIYCPWVVDEFGCVYHSYVAINEFTIYTTQDPACAFDSIGGRITTNFSGMPAGAQVWLTNENNDSIAPVGGNFEGLTGGTWYLHYDDGGSCQTIDTIVLLDPQPAQYSVETEVSSDGYGNAVFTSTVTAWGEWLPYLFYPNQVSPIINQCTDIDFEIIDDTEQPAVYQLSGLLSNCNIANDPFFNLCFSPTPGSATGFFCDCLEVYFLDGIEIPHDTIDFDTIVKPTKCLSEGNGSIEFSNISTYYDISPVFFVHSGDTLIWNGDPDAILTFSNLDLGTNTIYYWNAFSGMQSLSFSIEEAWDFTLSGNITSNASYNGQTIAVGQISLASGVKLEFVNCTLYTAYDTYTNIDQTQWTVNTNSRIILRYTTVESGCPQKWQGITVEGTNGVQQTYNALTGLYTNQGYVVIGSESVISDAKKAVYLKHGGVVDAQGANFINNEYSIYFDPYDALAKPIPENKSVISDNDFIVDSLLHTTAGTGTDRYQRAQVFVSGSKGGVSLLGNAFSFTASEITPDNRGDAICVNDSKFSIKPSLAESPVISDFLYGVRAITGTTSSKLIYIRECTFTDNYYGVSINNYLAPQVILNNFETDLSIYFSFPNLIIPTALYLESCSNYIVEQNGFTDGFYGAYIRNSGTSSNRIYNNDFEDVDYPAVANLVNSDFDEDYPYTTGTIGLQFKCNDFDIFTYAISVTGNMRKNQGNTGQGSSGLAGNRFYTPVDPNDAESEFKVDGSIDPSMDIPIYAYYCHLDLVCRPDLRTVAKMNYFPQAELYYENEACPDTYSQAKSTNSHQHIDIEELIYQGDSLAMLINEKKTELQQLVDNGNTLLLKAKAQMMNAVNYASVMQELSLSGMISNEVLFALMQNTVAPPAAKTSVLINNSPLPEAVKDQIDEMTDVDESLRDILKQYQDGENAREQKEREIQQIAGQKAEIETNLLQAAVACDSIGEIEAVIVFLLGQDEVNANKAALQLTTGLGNYDESRYILNRLDELLLSLPERKQHALDNYIRLQEIALEIEENYPQFDSIVLVNQDFLFEIAADTLTKDCGQAIALLEHAGLTEWIPVVYPPSGSSVAKSAAERSQPGGNAEGYLRISPNPANDHVFVEYFVANYDNEKEHYLSFIDMAGKKLLEVPVSESTGLLTIGIKDIPAGTYIVKLDPLIAKFVKQQ